MNIIVTQDSKRSTTGTVECLGRKYKCALGSSGIVSTSFKREGDGATPAGIYPLRQIFYRPDRVPRPLSAILVTELTPDMGWCEKSDHPDYNRLITHPHPATHDKMWREDSLFDLIAVIGFNDDPVKAGGGSAIFIHLARNGYPPTAGCIALNLADITALFNAIKLDTKIDIRAA